MFGYVTICPKELGDEGLKIFRAYYCGLCKTIGKRCSQSARMGLSYDITFLAIMLSAVNRNTPDIKDRKCLIHPMRKNPCVENDKATEYAADMGVMLSYLKLIDDWKDNRSIKALAARVLFAKGAAKTKKRYPDIYKEIKNNLRKLDELEKTKCTEIDETADCFAKIMECLFVPDFIDDKNEKRILAWIGYNIGRWIYIIDAYNDMDDDIKDGSYNTFVCKYPNKSAEEIKKTIRESLNVSLILTLENVSSAYELLTVNKNKEILDNIIYIALKMKQSGILGERNESL